MSALCLALVEKTGEIHLIPPLLKGEAKDVVALGGLFKPVLRRAQHERNINALR
jgi:hypothetical protein